MPDKVSVNDSVASVTLIDGDPVPLMLEGDTVTVELVNRYVEVATDGPLEEGQPLIRDDDVLDRAVDEVVLVGASEMVTVMTVPFTTLVIPWSDVVVPAGKVTTDVKVKVEYEGVATKEPEDDELSEAVEPDEPTEEVTLDPNEVG